MIAALCAAAVPAAHAAFMPRTSPCMPPEEMAGITGALPTAFLPPSYAKASLLAISEPWMAYAENSENGAALKLKNRASGSVETLGRLREDAVLLLDGSNVICLESNWQSNTLRIYSDGAPAYAHVFEPPVSGARKEPFHNVLCGPMLLLEDGLLLLLSKDGMLYACGADGSGLHRVADTTIADFVYYGGMIYFANMDDTVTYKNVYNETDDEYSDEIYPKLYRMKLDGSGQERLTDLGVWGLASQGPVILYQNIDEAFVFLTNVLVSPRFLSGPLWRYDAETGEHRALGIEAERYIPTPYGLAVWYNEYCLDPFNIDRADLILHDYDGNPLYRLDAGVVELLCDGCAAAEGVLEFFGFNWYPMMLWSRGHADSFDAGGEYDEFVFTTVPLDGSPKTGGMPEVPGWVEEEDGWE